MNNDYGLSEVQEAILAVLPANGDRMSMTVLRKQVAVLLPSASGASVGQSMRGLRDQDLVDVSYEGKHMVSAWRLTEGRHTQRVPSPPSIVAQSNPATEHQAIPEYLKRRPAQSLSLEESPLELDDVKRLFLVIGGNKFPISLMASLRVIKAVSLLRVHPQQEVYEGVTAVQVVFADEKVSTYQTNPAHLVIIAPRD